MKVKLFLYTGISLTACRNQTDMDAIFASSRGKHMRPIMDKQHPNPKHLFISAKSGATLEDLGRTAEAYVKKSSHPQRCHIYFMAGLCDVTYRDWDPDYSSNETYDEVIFNESPHQAFIRLRHTINYISNRITSLGAKPCFATIVPSSLKTWNNIRLEQNKTAFLIHHNHYDDMQTNMIKAILQINQHISAINQSNQMITPYIAETVITACKKPKPPRIHYNRLEDGVHPSDELREKWVDRIVTAIKKNRKRHATQFHINNRTHTSHQTDSDSDEDTQAVKRSWKRN